KANCLLFWQASGQGLVYLPPKFAAGTPRQRRRLHGGAWEPSHLCRLTPRETQILGCVARPLTNREVATELQLSEKTVKHCMNGHHGKAASPQSHRGGTEGQAPD